MTELKVNGKVEKVLEPIKGTSKAGKEWKKQTFIIKTDDTYNNTIAFGVFGEEKIDDIVNQLAPGDIVDVDFNVNCREFNDKYYTELMAWRVNVVEKVETTEPETEETTETDDGLPF